jgi:hypothetical protein
MQLAWGNVLFNANSCDFQSRTVAILSDSGRPVRYRTTVKVEGYLEADTQAELTALQLTLETALRVPYRNLVLLQDTGAASSARLLNAPSVTGCRVTDGPNFPSGAGEFATLRRFDFTCEAEYVIPTARSAVLSFNESVVAVGTGGPVTRHRPCVNAPPVKQVTYPASVIRTTQSGIAVGHADYPDFPNPLWPESELLDQRQRQRGSPRQAGRGYLEFPVSWSYVFESLRPLAGLPNRPPL